MFNNRSRKYLCFDLILWHWDWVTVKQKSLRKVCNKTFKHTLKFLYIKVMLQWCMAIMWGFVDSGAAIFPHSKPHIMEVAMNWADLCLGDFVWKEKGGWNKISVWQQFFLVSQNNRNANGLCLVAMCCPGIIKNYDNKFKQLLYLLVVPSQHLSCHPFVLEFHLKFLSLNMDSQHDHIHQGSLKNTTTCMESILLGSQLFLQQKGEGCLSWCKNTEHSTGFLIRTEGQW